MSKAKHRFQHVLDDLRATLVDVEAERVALDVESKALQGAIEAMERFVAVDVETGPKVKRKPAAAAAADSTMNVGSFNPIEVAHSTFEQVLAKADPESFETRCPKCNGPARRDGRSQTGIICLSKCGHPITSCVKCGQRSHRGSCRKEFSGSRGAGSNGNAASVKSDTCSDCGEPRSPGSAKQCRKCYERKTAPLVAQEQQGRAESERIRSFQRRVRSGESTLLDCGRCTKRTDDVLGVTIASDPGCPVHGTGMEVPQPHRNRGPEEEAVM